MIESDLNRSRNTSIFCKNIEAFVEKKEIMWYKYNDEKIEEKNGYKKW